MVLLIEGVFIGIVYNCLFIDNNLSNGFSTCSQYSIFSIFVSTIHKDNYQETLKRVLLIIKACPLKSFNLSILSIDKSFEFYIHEKDKEKSIC